MTFTESFLFRASNKIRIFVERSNKTITIDVKPTDSVNVVKTIINNKENIPIDQQVNISALLTF
jgi:hypothetical protein